MGEAAVHELGTPPLGLYVHLPWCVQKCPYCDFNSYRAPDTALPESRYIDALVADLDRDLELCRGRPIETVFFGGGTPSLFQADSFARFLRAVGERTELAVDAEITLEANPGTIEHGDFAAYRAAGINRVSLGAQSFAPAQLAALGRIHAADDTVAAVGELDCAGLANFNLDLMYALPGQSEELAAADLATAVGLHPPHLSYYHLTLEPGTAFHHHPPVLPDEERVLSMEADATRELSRHGYVRYEVSAWSRPGAECRHNLNYWRFGDYLGIGAGAHGKLTLAASGRIVRTVKPRHPASFLSAVLADGSEVGTRAEVVPGERPFEYMLNALRLAAGVPLADFPARTGLAIGRIRPTLDRLLARGLLEESGGTVRASALGWRFLNDVQAAFLDS
jgi:putative oxygen-independent coproporphyrinogen III oxidase